MDKLIMRGTTNMNGFDRIFTLVAIETNGSIQVGLSTCSEKDQFVRKVGVNIAEERANNRPIHGFSVDINKPYTRESILLVMQAIKDNISLTPYEYHKPYESHKYEMSTELG